MMIESSGDSLPPISGPDYTRGGSPEPKPEIEGYEVGKRLGAGGRGRAAWSHRGWVRRAYLGVSPGDPIMPDANPLDQRQPGPIGQVIRLTGTVVFSTLFQLDPR
jgi:hypothetical protein